MLYTSTLCSCFTSATQDLISLPQVVGMYTCEMATRHASERLDYLLKQHKAGVGCCICK